MPSTLSHLSFTDSAAITQTEKGLSLPSFITDTSGLHSYLTTTQQGLELLLDYGTAHMLVETALDSLFSSRISRSMLPDDIQDGDAVSLSALNEVIRA